MKLKKTNKPKQNFIKKLIISISILVVLIIIFVALEWAGVTHLINIPGNQTTDQKKEAEINSNNKKAAVESQATNKDADNGTPLPTDYASSDIVLSTRRETDGSVTILTQLKNYSDGTCDLTINNGGKIYAQSAPVLYQPSFSTCEGFNISIDKVGSGNWQISLSVTSKGNVNTNTISVEIQ